MKIDHFSYNIIVNNSYNMVNRCLEVHITKKFEDRSEYGYFA